MPWFITATVSETSVKELRGKSTADNSRCFGFYNSYVDATKAIYENRGNMHEGLYDLLVLEYMEEGIHPKVHKSEWWCWIFPAYGWHPLGDANVPIGFKSITNIALG